MKKYVKYLLFVVAVFGINLLTADAKQMLSKDIEPNSYLIGTHVFTSDTELTMKKIMLASKTISGNTEDDMIIYYKDPWGEWSDAVTGKVLSLAEKVEVEFVDLKQQIPVLQTPILEKVTYSEIRKDNIDVMVKLDLSDDSEVVGMELYSSKTTDGTFTKVSEYENDGDPYEYGLAIETLLVVDKANFGEYYKVRTYSIVDNQKIYSDFSNVVKITGLFGDVNNDGTLNRLDLQAMRQYLDGQEVVINELATDLNADGEIDDVDLMIFRKYFADWDIKFPYESGEKYNIVYNLDGGIQNDNNISKYAQISLSFTIEQPTKEGYIFLGWTGSNGTTPQKEVTIEEGTTGNLEYTANWVMLGDVNNDGRINTEDTSILRRYLANLDIPEEANVLYGDVNADGEIDDVDVMIIRKYRMDSSVDKLPYNSGEKYTIKYNLNGGSLAERNITTYAQISLPYTLDNPTKEGYIFLGWTGSNGDTPQKEVAIEESTTGNLEYTANWVLLGDVDNDKQVDMKDVLTLNTFIAGTTELDKNQKIAADVNLDKEIDDVDISILAKYYTDPEGYDIKLPYNSGNKYIIKYNLNDGKLANRNITTYAAISLPYELKTPTKEGYVFLGWTGSNGTTPQAKVTIEESTTGHLEYTANWALIEDAPAPSTPTIVNVESIWTRDGILDGVIDICETGEYDYQNKPVGAELYVKSENGYTLIEKITNTCLFGYELNPGEEKTYVARTYVMYNNNTIKVYSNYSNELLIKNENTITYELNGGINSSNNPIGYSSNQQYDSLLEQPTKEGCIFLGWTGSNGTTPQKEISIARGTTGNLNYTANWIKYGDVNQDGNVDIGDVTILSRYVTGLSELDENQRLSADVNLDKEIDDVDVTILQKSLSNKEITLPYDSGEKYTIIYNLDGGIIEEDRNITTYAPIALSYTLKNPKKEGYIFVGWTGSNGTTPQTEVTIEENTTGNLEYTANWEKSN